MRMAGVIEETDGTAPAPAPLAIRLGEHACCRFTLAADRSRLTRALVQDGIHRGHKVVYLCDDDDRSGIEDSVRVRDGHEGPVAVAIDDGQVEVRPAQADHMPAGRFDAGAMPAYVRGEQLRARAEGYRGLSLTGDLSWALAGRSGHARLREFETGLSREPDAGDRIVLCLYDHGRVDPGLLSRLASAHDVDFAPELAEIGRTGRIAAARVAAGELRLAGELDYHCAHGVAEALEAHFHGPQRIDLSGVTYADVPGMRALQGRRQQSRTIVGASPAVRQLARLCGWDDDPHTTVED
jgi:anti-anti-sigma regulatory factor